MLVQSRLALPSVDELREGGCRRDLVSPCVEELGEGGCATIARSAHAEAGSITGELEGEGIQVPC